MNGYAEILTMYAAAEEDGVKRPRLADIADAAGVSIDRVQVIADAAVEARHLRSFKNGRPVCYAITPDGVTWLLMHGLSKQGSGGPSCLVKGCAFEPLDTIPLCGAHERQLPGALRSRWWSKRKAKALNDLREWAKTATAIAPADTYATTRKGMISDAEDLVARAIANAGRYRVKPLWSHVMHLFAVGSTRAYDLCRARGYDPEQEVGPSKRPRRTL